MKERSTADALEQVLKESLESEIIALLSEKKNLSPRDAMDIYYRSKLSCQISNGDFGIQYLSAEYLVSDIFENESELFHTGL